MDEMKQEQMCAIKNRLLNKFHESNLTIYRLLEEAKNISGFSLNYDTFRKTLDPNSTTLDIYSVLALCRYWNLDVSYILSSPDTKETPMPDVEKMVNTSKFRILDDEKYTGTFHGYMYSHKEMFSHMKHFELTIHKSAEHFKANLTLHAISKPDGIHETKFPKHLTGTPILVNSNVIFIILTNSLGEFFILSFNYTPYRRGTLYFKQGFILSCATEVSHPVLMQRFVLFSKPISPEHMKDLPSFLLLNNRIFHVPADAMEELAQANPNVQKIFDHFGYLLEHSRKEMYCINEAQLLNSYDPAISVNEILKGLIAMKSVASDATRIFIADSTILAEFSKLL